VTLAKLAELSQNEPMKTRTPCLGGVLVGCMAASACSVSTHGARASLSGRGAPIEQGRTAQVAGAVPGVPGSTTPAVQRGGRFLGFAERFNRYYTDKAWKPSRTLYVGPRGSGDGSSPTSPGDVAQTLRNATPGTSIVFARGRYAGCFQLDREQSGSYEDPIVLVGERNPDGSPGVAIDCCTTGWKSCFNLEAANYVAIDGFELVGGNYGVRAVGAGFAANRHQVGIAVLDSLGHHQHKDPFFSGQSDWLVLERCTGHDVGTGDGHGIYLSNGSDWNIVRYNETYNTRSSDFQINADPAFTCTDEGIDLHEPECDAVAGSSSTGGRGVSDFMLVDGNYFHHSLAQGPNFTSVRNSIVSNNIFALPTRHGASFWQETDNPRLGSSNNLIAHNLFVTSVDRKPILEVINHATHNQIENNVFAAVTVEGDIVTANPSGQLLETDGSTVTRNTFARNVWLSGYAGARDRSPPHAFGADEQREARFRPTWFVRFSASLGHDPAVFAPTPAAPWLDTGRLLDRVPTDRNGVPRRARTDPGPFER
jgi:hypothetical protein